MPSLPRAADASRAPTGVSAYRLRFPHYVHRDFNGDIAMQPHGNWFRGHVLSWSETAGIDYVVKDLGTWLGVLAFGIGYTLGLTLEPAPAPAPEVVAPPARDRSVADRRAADEPLTAERREVTDEERVREGQPVR